MTTTLPSEALCTYVLAVNGGWEYGYEVAGEKMNSPKIKRKRGYAATIEDALKQNGMSLFDKEAVCSGKRSARSHDSPLPRRGRPPRSELHYSLESVSTTS